MEELYTDIKRGTIVLLLGKGSREPQSSDRTIVPTLFFFIMLTGGNREGKNYTNMKKIVCILISTCCLVCNSFAQCLKFNYEGARMYPYEKKDYDPSSGIIKIDLDKGKVGLSMKNI